MCHPHVPDVPRISLDMLPKFVTRFTYNQPPTLFFVVLIATLITPCMLQSNNHQRWWNPCTYNPNKAGRTVRCTNALKQTVSRHILDFNSTRKRIEEIYGPKNYTIAPKKFKNMTLESFYKEFVELGKKYEKAIKVKLNTHDNNFSLDNRNTLMEEFKNVVIVILCEMYDAIKFKKSTKRKINQIKSKQDNIKIPRKSNLTDLIQIDEHIQTSYESLLRALEQFLKKRLKLRHGKYARSKTAGKKLRPRKKKSRRLRL